MNEMRLLFDPPACGAWNMAVDEALLETAAISGLATLRFYSWEEPTLSLGYFQSAADRYQHAASRDCPLVRRASGGGAIIHDRELTYSIALPQQIARPEIASKLYDAAHETLIETLATLGVTASLFRTSSDSCGSGSKNNKTEPFLCFERWTCGDVVCRNAKIAGSAQRRRRGAVLQHGSVLLATSTAAPSLPGIAELTGRHLAADELATAWKAPLLNRISAMGYPGKLSAQEHERAAELAKERFGAAEFAARR
jgi:lipoate-protein ligase A